MSTNPIFDQTLEDLSKKFTFENEAQRKAWIDGMDHKKRGKGNRLKIGDVVQVKPECVKWHATHLAWCYAKPAPKDDGYSEGDKEIDPESLSSVLGWAHAHFTARCPIGIVTHYGATDDGKVKDRKNVYVQLMFRVGSIRIPYGTYLAEHSLWKKKVDKKTGKVVS